MNTNHGSLAEWLRPLVGLDGWDYCVVWKLSEDQRFLKWVGCCCGGIENSENASQEHIFHVTHFTQCKDVMFPHPKTKTCDLLSQLPSSQSMNSGTHAETLISSKPRWLYNSNSSDSSIILEETFGTRVLIPLGGILIELFVAKQVAEDQHIIDFVTTQYPVVMDTGLCYTSAMNRMKEGVFDGSDESFLSNKQTNSLKSRTEFNNELLQEITDHEVQNSMMMNNAQNMNLEFMESLGEEEQQRDNKRSDSVSYCTERIDDEDDVKYSRRNRKGPQAKNLEAERKRRKKLNDRLYILRSLVPKISKLDKATILSDAIEFVKDLKKQERELQHELEDHILDVADDGGPRNNNINGANLGPQNEQSKPSKGFHLAKPLGNIGKVSKQMQELETITPYNKTQQIMEPQVEVSLIDGNEYFVKVFCEHKRSGFIKLMEAFDNLGMEVTNVNVNRHQSLVSNAFKVKAKQKEESEMVHAEDVRDYLLELTRNPLREWSDIYG